MAENSVKLLAERLYWVISAAMLLLPLLALVAVLGNVLPEFPPPTVISGGELMAIWAVGAVVLAALLWVLWQMRALLDCYRRGEVLTDRAAMHILRVGQGLGLLAGLRLLSSTALVLIVTHDNPPGQRMLSIAISSDTVGLALASGLLILIGWAMRQAAEVAQENASFV